MKAKTRLLFSLKRQKSINHIKKEFKKKEQSFWCFGFGGSFWVERIGISSQTVKMFDQPAGSFGKIARFSA
jgi:hypothetical protein